MISSNLIETVRACAEDFDVKSVWLFGSALEDENKATDIDLPVEGLRPDKFFDFSGRLFFGRLRRHGRGRQTEYRKCAEHR